MRGLMWQLISILLVLIYHVHGKHYSYDPFHGDGAMEDLPHELDTESDLMNTHESSGDFISNVDNINHFPMETESKTSGIHRIPVKPHRCYYYPAKGSCKRYYRRYYYDHVLNTCKVFVYTGCGGNGNRFFTRAGCMKTCAV